MTHQIDVTKGSSNTTVSRQWANRPDDQRFLNLTDLHAQTLKWAQESYTKPVMPADIVALSDPAAEDGLLVKVGDAIMAPTHYGFSQIAALAGAPAGYLRSIPAALTAVNLNYGLKAAKQQERLSYLRQNGSLGLRAITSTRYGRIFDYSVVEAVQKIAGNGTGDTAWKVPGCIDWGAEHGVAYNPHVDITKDNTTLYASDRDVFLFLVDDTHPIEVGKLANGEPDLMFRGFYVWNSEVGERTFGVATMYLRGVCQNRCLWGVEGFSEITFKHTRGAPERFVTEAGPALATFTGAATDKLVAGVSAAKAAKVATTEEERLAFLAKFGFSESKARAVIAKVEQEEQALPETVWDFSQGITALARGCAFQDQRIALEGIAGKMLDKVAVPA